MRFTSCDVWPTPRSRNVSLSEGRGWDGFSLGLAEPLFLGAGALADGTETGRNHFHRGGLFRLPLHGP